MHDIKKKLVLASLLFLATPSYAEVYGCMDDEGYTQIHEVSLKALKDTLTVRLMVDEPLGIDLVQKSLKGLLEVRLYGSYINQDHLQLSPSVSLLDYTGFTMLKVVGGKRIISHKIEGKHTLVLVIKT